MNSAWNGRPSFRCERVFFEGQRENGFLKSKEKKLAEEHERRVEVFSPVSTSH